MNPQLLADLLAAGSNAYVANLRSQGYGFADIIDRLGSAFPGASYQTRNAAFDRGVRAFEAGNLMDALPGGGRLTAAQVPRGGTGGLAWRYNVFVTLHDLETGQDITRTFAIHSLHSLSHNDLAAQAQNAVAVYAATGDLRPGSPGTPPGAVVTGMDVFAVERW